MHNIQPPPKYGYGIQDRYREAGRNFKLRRTVGLTGNHNSTT